MKIYVCIHAGLCSGARLAVETAYENLNENLYMYGEVLHNPTVITQLKREGAKVINSINEIKFLENKRDIVVLIRAHGVPKSVIDELEENSITYIDKTCQEVKKIHEIVQRKSKQGYKILIIGNKKHPEVIGTKGWAVGESVILENIDEVKKYISGLENELEKYCVVVQTTYNSRRYKEIVDFCKMHLKRADYFNTICSDTEDRQLEIAELSQKADVVVVIGGKSSSNTNKLYNIASNNCKNVQFIETYKELDFSKINIDSFIVITGGASTPENVIRDVVKCLQNFGSDMNSPLM